MVLTWERRLAKKYYDKLFKEYAIADLSRYEEGAIGLRWRTEREVVSGKGQFSCGAKRCEGFNDLESYEVDFSYREAGEKKQALVKLRVCKECARRLNYRHARKKARRQAKEERREAKRQRVSSPSGQDLSGGGGSEACSGSTAAPSRLASDAASRQSQTDQPRAAQTSSDGRVAGTAAAATAVPSTMPPTEEPRSATGATGAAGVTGPTAALDTVWSQPVHTEKAIGDEFDEFFDDLLQ